MAFVNMELENILGQGFATIPGLIRLHAQSRPDQAALILDKQILDYRALDEGMDRVAAALQRDGIKPSDIIAICAGTSFDYLTVFLGSLRAGVAVAPLAPSSNAEALAAMVADAGAKKLFVDQEVARMLSAASERFVASPVVLDGAGSTGLEGWLAKPGIVPDTVEIQPDWPCNVIYSSGTTGVPKGIMQPCSMRWSHVQRAAMNGYGPDAVTLLSTPLYSNTTLVHLLGAIALGGTIVLMAKFDTTRYLELSERYRVTHTVLVPVQYQRLMSDAGFDGRDLSSCRMKFSTGAPFSAALKAEVLRRWPGGLIEVYGMTEGGGVCMLEGHRHPDKLHTVGVPMRGNEIRLIDEQGREVPPGESGEIVGHSRSMMQCYLNQPEKTAEAEWYAPDGKRFIRTGDVGRFDTDGFLMLLDRKKDMIISGGFNIYPSDLEAVLRAHPDIEDVSVVGVPSARWGETPVAFVVPKKGVPADGAEMAAWANDRLGKMQRLADVQIMSGLPRSGIGKVLKRELRDSYTGQGRS